MILSRIEIPRGQSVPPQSEVGQRVLRTDFQDVLAQFNCLNIVVAMVGMIKLQAANGLTHRVKTKSFTYRLRCTSSITEFGVQFVSRDMHTLMLKELPQQAFKQMIRLLKMKLKETGSGYCVCRINGQ